MLKTKQINNYKISKIHLPSIDEKVIKGGDLLPLYSNTFICAKKNSGKTTVIFNLIRKCIDRDTVVHMFVSTIEKDRSWLQIVAYLKKKGIQYHAHMSIVDNNGNDLIRNIIDQPINFSDDDDGDDDDGHVKQKSYSFIRINEQKQDNTTMRRKKRKLAQKQIIILDDIGNELKKPSIDQLLKINRHLRSKVILSSQYLNDLSPQARRQIDIWLLFNGCKKEKLLTIMRDCDTHLDYHIFEQMYKFATDEKYNFLYIDCHNSKFRRNFNQEIDIPDG
jgi:hypothetical protein